MAKWVMRKFMIDIERAKITPGWMYESELETLAKWSNRYPSIHNRIIEVGSWMGRSTRAICDNSGAVVICVDAWKPTKEAPDWDFELAYKEFHENLRDHIDSGRLIIFQGDSVETAHELVKVYGKRYADMVFLDAGHNYEYIRDDILAYKPLVKIGGLLCGHDYNWPGVEQAVKELLPNFTLSGNMWVMEV